MREIRFRAIHKLTKHWFEESNIVFENGKWFEDGRAHEDYRPMNLEQVAVMQYTGLKDKNGVDIYEGDIVTLKEEVSGYEEPNKIVIFHKGSFGWRDNEIGFVPFSILDRPKESIEVIGDIYENPELLGDNQ